MAKDVTGNISNKISEISQQISGFSADEGHEEYASFLKSTKNSFDKIKSIKLDSLSYSDCWELFYNLPKFQQEVQFGFDVIPKINKNIDEIDKLSKDIIALQKDKLDFDCKLQKSDSLRNKKSFEISSFNEKKDNSGCAFIAILFAFLLLSVTIHAKLYLGGDVRDNIGWFSFIFGLIIWGCLFYIKLFKLSKISKAGESLESLEINISDLREYISEVSVKISGVKNHIDSCKSQISSLVSQISSIEAKVVAWPS
jgi:hypothetical protein